MHRYSYQFVAMASPCEVSLFADNDRQSTEWRDIAEKIVGQIERKFSRYRSDSLVAKINAAAGSGQWVDVDAETEHLLNFCDQLFKIGGGLFDPTSGILRRVWDFQQSTIPPKDLIMKQKSLINWRWVEREGHRVRLTFPQIELDFGGIVKEYAVDQVVGRLLVEGVQCGYVNLGGDFRVIGPHPNGEPWNVAIQNPGPANSRQSDSLPSPAKTSNSQEVSVGDYVQACICQIPITHGALATCGDYERYIEVDGQRYCHIINPLTGYPVNHRQSVSVLAPLCLLAGSFSTFVMLMEADGLAFLKAQGLRFFAIDQAGQHFYQ